MKVKVKTTDKTDSNVDVSLPLINPLILSRDPLNPLEAVTKQYVDTTIDNNLHKVNTGSILQLPTKVSPDGYVKCNGAYLSINDFRDLYSVIEHNFDTLSPLLFNYVTYNSVGSGAPQSQHYDINKSQNAAAISWSTSDNFSDSSCYTQSVVTKNRVYILGGYIDGAPSSTIYTATIDVNGKLNAWTNSGNLPVTLYYGNSFITKNRIYLVGGFSDGVESSKIYTAVINVDGTLGTWSNITSSLPPIHGFQVLVTKSNVYLIGGKSSNSDIANVYTTSIDSDGLIGNWVAHTSLPEPLGCSQLIVTKNRVYIAGGTSNSVYYSIINKDGILTNWVKYTSLPKIINGSHVYVTNTRVYLFGGITATALPSSVTNGSLISVYKKLYIIGGYVGAAISNKVHVATISGSLNDYTTYYNGSINSFDNNFNGLVNRHSNTDLTLFGVPDFSLEDINGVYHYIKT